MLINRQYKSGEAVQYPLKTDPSSSHQQIARLARELGCGPILDVGSAQGMLGQLLEGSGLAIDAVEPNTIWAEAAKPFYRNVYASMIEEVPLPEETYRTIVCADVLEHTVNPIAVLERLKRLATDDSTFIISLPNIAHVAVRLMLLFGLFPKMERGPLDKTHLHFFTHRTAANMLRQAGFNVQRVLATGVPLEQFWSSGLLLKLGHRLQSILIAVMPRLLGFQWIFIAKPCLVHRMSKRESTPKP